MEGNTSEEMQICQNKCLKLALGLTYYVRTRSMDLHDPTDVPMIKTRMTALAIKTFRSPENTRCFKDLVLNHEIVQKLLGSNTILDQLLAAIEADTSQRAHLRGVSPFPFLWWLVAQTAVSIWLSSPCS